MGETIRRDLITSVVKKLIGRGWIREHTSKNRAGEATSRYLTLPQGVVMRISDHTIGDAYNEITGTIIEGWKRGGYYTFQIVIDESSPLQDYNSNSLARAIVFFSNQIYQFVEDKNDYERRAGEVRSQKKPVATVDWIDGEIGGEMFACVRRTKKPIKLSIAARKNYGKAFDEVVEMGFIPESVTDRIYNKKKMRNK